MATIYRIQPFFSSSQVTNFEHNTINLVYPIRTRVGLQTGHFIEDPGDDFSVKRCCDAGTKEKSSVIFLLVPRSRLDNTILLFLHDPSTLYHSFRYLDLFHDTRSYLFRVHYQTSPFFYLVPRSFVQRAGIPWLDLWKRAIQRRAPWLFTSEENYNGESFNRGYKCLLVNNSSWGGKEKKKKKRERNYRLIFLCISWCG